LVLLFLFFLCILGEQFPPDMALEIAKKIKEAYCYVCPDLVKEYQKFDSDATKFRQLVMKNPVSNQEFKVDVGYERFLAPEVFFSPEIFGSGEFSEPLSSLVDKTVQMCPIDTRKPLYNYITLSGGSTMFKHFTKRLERDVRRLVKERYDMIQAQYPDRKINAPQANVITHAFQRFAVWFGGSMLASQPEFLGYFHTRQQYQEIGPRIARHNPVFQQVT
jgi:actin-related protein 3